MQTQAYTHTPTERQTDRKTDRGNIYARGVGKKQTGLKTQGRRQNDPSEQRDERKDRIRGLENAVEEIL